MLNKLQALLWYVIHPIQLAQFEQMLCVSNYLVLMHFIVIQQKTERLKGGKWIEAREE